TGSGNINGTGNGDNNVITGNSGANLINGGNGADTMSGGLGDDTYVVGQAGDIVFENASEGIDTINSTATYTLSANVENLVLLSNTNINGTGNELNNVLTGNSGNNILDGLTGADTMAGGAGDDIYVVDNAGDMVTEAASAGTDTVRASITYALTANVENLTLMGIADINGTGNSLANALTGNGGANWLDGGTGADTMSGGAGDDTYIVDNAADTVTEVAGQGTDLVMASLSYVLAVNVENLTLTGSAAIDGTGNSLANILTGNSGNNTLDGKTGADTMAGGIGNDTYFVDNSGDVVIENASAGTDTVQSSITYALTDNVERLTLTGSGNIGATGNSLDNILTGNSGDNVLDGGAGADKMSGGAGDDTYMVDNTGDTIVEAGSSGTDQVFATVSYTLSSGVENLTLNGGDDINGTGNAANNVLIGNSGVNLLSGGGNADKLYGMGGNDILIGGSGNDSLYGGAGSDTFVFDAAGTANGVDHFYDFEAGVDHLSFSSADYGFAAGHNLTASELVYGAHAIGTNNQFYYNAANHTLYWDVDGTGGTASVAIATFENLVAPTTSDFIFT
nr:calcium-binding protein [Asticcacaulis sp.]